MKTYSIAYVGNHLIAVVPDSDDVAAAVEEVAAQARIELDEYTVESGLILTNDEPEDADKIRWTERRLPKLHDEDGIYYDYAVKL